MTRIVFCTLFFVVVCGSISAKEDDSVFLHPLQDNELVMFIEICTELSSHRISSGNFIQEKIIKKLNRKLVSRGTFVIYSPLGIIWKTETPFPSVSAVGKDFIIQQTGQGKKQKLSASGNESFLKISAAISAVFSGSADNLFNNFRVYFLEKSGEWSIGLIPIDRTLREIIKNIVISGDLRIKRVILSEQNGDSIQYELSNYIFPEELSENDQSFFNME
jgi:hypothetical protein